MGGSNIRFLRDNKLTTESTSRLFPNSLCATQVVHMAAMVPILWHNLPQITTTGTVAMCNLSTQRPIFGINQTSQKYQPTNNQIHVDKIGFWSGNTEMLQKCINHPKIELMEWIVNCPQTVESGVECHVELLINCNLIIAAINLVRDLAPLSC